MRQTYKFLQCFLILIIIINILPIIFSSLSLRLTVFTDNLVYGTYENVTIYGNLTYNEMPISDNLVSIKVQNPNMETIMLRSVTTGPQGNYSLTFRLPLDIISGIYTVYATSSFSGETSSCNTSFNLKITAVTLTWNNTEFWIGIASNTTIVNALVYRNIILFNVTGFTGEAACINITMPRDLNTTEITLFFDGNELTPPPFPIVTRNITHYFIYVEFILSNHIVVVKFWILGDITGPLGEPDLTVDMRDVGMVARAFGTFLGHPDWDSTCDVTGPSTLIPDGTIDMRDVAVVARNFGAT